MSVHRKFKVFELWSIELRVLVSDLRPFLVRLGFSYLVSCTWKNDCNGNLRDIYGKDGLKDVYIWEDVHGRNI